MLDRRDAGAHGAIEAIPGVRVRHHLPAEPRGFVHDRLQLVIVELLGTDRVSDREDAAGCHDLDLVGAVLGVEAHLLPDGVDAVDDGARAGDLQRGTPAVDVGVTARAAERGSRGVDAWPRDESARDRIADGDVDIACGARLADGRETRIQRLARVDHRVDRAVRRRLLEDREVATVVVNRRQVGVAVDEAGQQGVPGQVDDRGASAGC